MHQTENDERRTFATRRLESIRTVGCRRDAVSHFPEMKDDERDDVRIVVDNENALTSRDGRVRHAGLLSDWFTWSARGAARRRPIFATIISMATGLCPPRGTITSA